MIRQKSFEKDGAALYLVATPIGNLEEMTPRAVSVLKEADVIAAEDTRNTGKLLKHFEIGTKMIAYHLFNEEESAEGIIKLLKEGKKVAVVSDAGYPLLSDPGQTVTNKASECGFPVVVVNGPNACLSALVGSGLPAQPFTFYGFLGSKKSERVKALKKLEKHEETLVFYEAPHRIGKMLEDCLEVLGDRRMCLARELTKIHEEFIRGTVSEVLEIADGLKGEMVVVMEGYRPEEETLKSEDWMTVIENYIAAGESKSSAIRKTAERFGISKNEIYKEYFNEDHE